jgi:hypothetical protein
METAGTGGGQPTDPVQGNGEVADINPVADTTGQERSVEQQAENGDLSLAQEVRSLLQGMRAVFQAAGGPSRVDRGPDMDQKVVTDILKRPLNPRATDMAQELDAFFEHIEEYFQAAKLTDLSSAA